MASSIFGKDPSDKPTASAYARERIEKEIEHLKKPKSTRYGPNERMTLGIFVSGVIAAAIAALYLMDPLLYAWHKGDAVQAYLYLHNYDSDLKAQALVTSGILTPDEATLLNHRQGSFQDYYSSPEQAEKTADSLIAFMNDMSKLRSGPYQDLDTLGKIRYNLFCRWGLIPPSQFSFLNPAIKSE
jgi:hypothetical protein